MKALIITYYWPPAGGSGVQRWLKFVKYLRAFGIEPVIYTVKDPQYPIEDNSLLKDIPKDIEVLRQPIWELNSLLKKSSKKTSAGFLNANPSFFGKIAQYIRANYFIPDARKFWVKPSIKYLSNYLSEHPVDVVVSTGPPHSLHLIGLGLKEKLAIKWIADFRDPWTEIDYFHQLPLTTKSIEKHRFLEQKVLRKADAVVVVGETMSESYKKYTNKIKVITNGYDSNDRHHDVNLDSKFSLVHIGMMNADRNHIILWETLQELIKESEDFAADLELKFIGAVADEVIKDLNTFDLKKYANLISYVPHDEVLQYQTSAQVLMLLVNNVPSAKGIITGKIFEYLQAKRPILAIAPTNGDLAEILNNTRVGEIVDFTDKKQLKKSILKYYKRYKQGGLVEEGKNIEQYHRKSLTKQLVDIIKEIA